MKIFLILSILTILSLPSVANATFPSWDNINTIYYNPAQDDATNKFLLQAANELKTHLENVSLKTFTIINTTATTPPAIFLINDSSHPKLTGKNEESFWLYTNDSGVYIIGKTPIAVRHGAYTLLEKLEFRYFFKHPIWKIKPSSLISLDGLNEVQEPDFIYRLIWVGPPSNYLYPDWMKWNRMGGAKGVGITHSYFGIIPDSEFSTNPSLFCTDKNSVPRQLNLDNPEVLTRAITYARNYFLNNPTGSNYNIGDTVTTASVAISPNDGWGWDSCYGTNVTIITEKVFNFSNEVTKALKIEFPDKYIATFDYSLYSGVPSFNLESNVLAVATTRYVYSGLSLGQRLSGLAERGATLGIYDYYDVPPWYYDMPETGFYQKLNNIRLIAKYGAKVFIAESANGWGARGPLFYTATKLHWDANASIDLILDDFYTKAFGPAKDSIKRYYDRWNNGQTVNDRTLGLAFRDLALAEKQAEGYPEIQERIRYLQYYLRHVWRYTNLANLTLEEAKDYYSLLCSIKNLEVNSFDIWGSPSRVARNELYNRGVSSEEVISLCDYASPTNEDAKKWKREALEKLVIDKDLIDAVKLDIDKDYVKPLGLTSNLPRLSSSSGGTKWVIAQASDTVKVKTITYGGGRLYWTAPDGSTTEKTVSGAYNWQEVSFQAPLSGTYILSGLATDVINHPAALIQPDQVQSSPDYTESFYFYVPPNTPALVVGTTWGLVQLYDPNGQLVLDKEWFPSPAWPAEWGVRNPLSGIWKITCGTKKGFWILGVPSLFGNDPNNLLVSTLPGATSLSAPTEVVTADFLLPQQAAQAVVNGPGVTMKSRIYYYFSSPNTVQAEKPSFVAGATNFRIDEAGATKAVTDLGTKISWSADPTKISFLLFDMPSPKIISEIVVTDDGINYAKEITISSDISLQDVLAKVKINPAYSNWKVAEKDSLTGNWVDKTTAYNLAVSGDTATFSGFGLSTKEFRITGALEPTKWWNASWQYRKKLTLNLTGETLNDFPVLVILNSSNFDYSKTKSDGSDLRFISQDTATVLNYHIEKWEPTTTSTIWVKVPRILANTNNWIWLYYGNPTALDIQNKSGTFDSNYLAAWHLDETGNAIDSTINNNTASCTICPLGASGISGKARNLDGTQSFSINVPIASGQPFTLEAWIKPNRDYLPKVDGDQFTFIEGRLWMFYGGRPAHKYNTIHYYNRLATGGTDLQVWVPGLYKGTWYHVTIVYDGGQMRIYLNGGMAAKGLGTHYGDTLGSIGNNFNGIMDEIRISNTSRSSEWLKTTYLTVTNQFITYGTEELQTADVTPPIRSNGQPSGTLQAGTKQTNISLTTNEQSTCRYSTTAIPYSSMTTLLVTGGITHSSTITVLIDGTSYKYYVKCSDANGNINTDDYTIAFSVASPVVSPAPVQAPSATGGGGAVVPIDTPTTSPITKEPETIKPAEVKQETGSVSLELTTPDTVESGELYNVTVKLLSPVKKTYTLTISNIKQNVELEAGKEKLITIPILAPEARGSFALIVSIDGTTKSKIINLDYKPLFLYVNETTVANETLLDITVKNYQPLSTELRIIKDGRSDVFIELIEGKKEYQRQLKLTQSGEYKIIAVASSEGKTIDTDSYMLTISGKPTFDYRLFLILAFAFVVIVMTLTFLIK